VGIVSGTERYQFHQPHQDCKRAWHNFTAAVRGWHFSGAFILSSKREPCFSKQERSQHVGYLHDCCETILNISLNIFTNMKTTYSILYFSLCILFYSRSALCQNASLHNEVFIQIETNQKAYLIGEEAVIAYYVYSLAPFLPNEIKLNNLKFAYTWEEECTADKMESRIVSFQRKRYNKLLIKKWISKFYIRLIS